jgi:hypothetical protein
VDFIYRNQSLPIQQRKEVRTVGTESFWTSVRTMPT